MRVFGQQVADPQQLLFLSFAIAASGSIPTEAPGMSCSGKPRSRLQMRARIETPPTFESLATSF